MNKKEKKPADPILSLALIILNIVIICIPTSNSTKACMYINCHEKKEIGSDYCKAHQKYNYRSRSYKSSPYKSSSGSSSSNGSSSSYGSSSSSKKYSSDNTWKSYDKGYEDVYFDDDYDLKRYNSDPDYADGVDDAMEDEEW